MMYGWLLCIFFCIVGELHTPGLFFLLSGAGGAGAAALLAWYGYSLMVQVMVFVIGTVICAVMLHAVVKRTEKKTGIRTNGDALIGMKGTIVRSCSLMERGLVYVRGETWSSYAVDHQLKEGDVVEIVALRGCHLTVKLMHDKEPGS